MENILVLFYMYVTMHYYSAYVCMLLMYAFQFGQKKIAFEFIFYFKVKLDVQTHHKL